jgi:Flp pilus assembly protein TadD
MATDLTPKVEPDLRAAVEQTRRLLQWKREYRRALDLLDSLRCAVPALAHRFDPDAASLVIAQGDEAEGVAEFKRLIGADPNDIYLRSALGAELIGIGRYDEAEQTLRAAASLRPRQPLIEQTLIGCSLNFTGGNPIWIGLRRRGAPPARSIQPSTAAAPI